MSTASGQWTGCSRWWRVPGRSGMGGVTGYRFYVHTYRYCGRSVLGAPHRATVYIERYYGFTPEVKRAHRVLFLRTGKPLAGGQ
jgi:hypothetical protein